MAATELDAGPRRDVAGYLYGIAAECAIKAMMLDVGMRPDSETSSGDPFFVHFPKLKTMVRDGLQGRRGTPLLKYIEDDSFLSNWAIRMRYCHGREIDSRWVDQWAKQAKQAVADIGT